MSHSTDDLIEALRAVGDTLPEELREAFLAADGDEVDGKLVEIMQSDALLSEDRSAYAPPAHAAMLLGLRRADRGIDPLVEVVAEEGTSTARGTAAGTALQNIGSRGLDVILEEIDRRSDPGERTNLASTLGGFVVDRGDARIADALFELLESAPVEHKESVLLQIGMLDDPRAADRLSTWLVEADLDPERIPQRLLIEFGADTIERLGGEWNDEIEALVERTRLLSDAPEKGAN